MVFSKTSTSIKIRNLKISTIPYLYYFTLFFQNNTSIVEKYPQFKFPQEVSNVANLTFN